MRSLPINVADVYFFVGSIKHAKCKYSSKVGKVASRVIDYLSDICTVHLTPTYSLPGNPRTKVQHFALRRFKYSIYDRESWLSAVGLSSGEYGSFAQRVLWRFSVSSCLIVYTVLRVRSDPSLAYCCIIFPSPRSGGINVLSHDERHCASVWEIQPRPRLPSARLAKKKQSGQQLLNLFKRKKNLL